MRAQEASPRAAAPTQILRSGFARPAPFIKWAGGKSQLLRTLVPLVPAVFDRYVEPFLGGGAMFFALAPRASLLSDINSHLVDAYRTVRDEPRALMAALDAKRHGRSAYYEERSADSAELSEVERAARFIYLNKTCFNGLYRENRAGRFNVPFGSRPRPPALYDAEALLASSRALRGASIERLGFHESLANVRSGDFVYLDPPYAPMSETANFTTYSADGFSLLDQDLLRSELERMDGLGARWMLSNSDTPFTRWLYRDFRVEAVQANRAINRDGAKRGPVSELVVRNY